MTDITEIIAEFEKQTIAEIKKIRSDILVKIIFYCPCILIMSVLEVISMVSKGMVNDLNVFFLLLHLLAIINMVRMIRQDYDALWELKCFSHSKYLPHLFPEEVSAELYCLRERLARENKSILQIRLTMSMEILRLIIAFVQIKIENLWLPSGDRNKVDQ